MTNEQSKLGLPKYPMERLPLPIRTKSKQSLQILNRSEPLKKTADMDVEAVWAAKAYPSMAGYHACTVDAAPQPVEGA